MFKKLSEERQDPSGGPRQEGQPLRDWRRNVQIFEEECRKFFWEKRILIKYEGYGKSLFDKISTKAYEVITHAEINFYADIRPIEWDFKGKMMKGNFRCKHLATRVIGFHDLAPFDFRNFVNGSAPGCLLNDLQTHKWIVPDNQYPETQTDIPMYQRFVIEGNLNTVALE